MVVATQDHHPVPQAWVRQGATPADPETVPLCGTSHDAEHTLLNEYVYHGGEPPWDDHRHPGSTKVRPGRRRFNAYLRRMAADAWTRRPSDRPPYTTAQPA